MLFTNDCKPEGIFLLKTPGNCVYGNNDLSLHSFNAIELGLARVASASVWFWSKERPRNEILGFGRARNETRAKK